MSLFQPDGSLVGQRQPGQPAMMPQAGMPSQYPQAGAPAQYPQEGLPAQMPMEGSPAEMPQEGRPAQDRPLAYYTGNPLVDNYIHAFIGTV